MAATSLPKEPVVVVGSACRFPGGANSPSKLWELLKEPRDLQSEVPKQQRFDPDTFYHADGSVPGRTNARHGYFLRESLHAFDASFFNIAAAEAESIDPQQRLLLETTYEAVASAGVRLQDLRGSDTAVYVGIMCNDYAANSHGDTNHSPTYLVTGAAPSIASNRLSYFFDWHGPSMTIDTACSSSLVAVHQAVQQLRSGTSKVAVAAGANLILSPVSYILESKVKMLSPTGRSRMWDEKADGYARGEGVAAVVLKTLSQALADGDSIECVIRETGVNQDGKTTGITMPSNVAQQRLIRETYTRAGLDATKDRCQFFEAHGTGTPAGDPQEAEAIARAFFDDNTPVNDNGKLYVGSIKTVIGHTEGTAGIAGLLKASLAVQHGVIPPNMLFDQLSPSVAPFYNHLEIATKAQPWPELAPGERRRASVNSFGFGGTNAHAIIEEYRPDSTSAQDGNQQETTLGLPLVLSANSDKSLKAVMESTLKFIKSNRSIDMADLAWTLLRKHSALPFRHAVASPTRESAALALEKAIKNTELSSNFGSSSPSPRLLGVFTGQGAQWPSMLKALVSTVAYARGIVAELDHSLQTLPVEYRPSWTLQDEINLEGEASHVALAAFSQPLCAAVQIVLVQLLAAAGVEFSAIVGHSSGEIGAAFAAGFISASQAIRIAYLRGLCSKYASGPNGENGGMLAAGMSLDDAQELCGLEDIQGRVCVAASNSPDSTTLSGDADAIQQVLEILEDESKFARVLKVDKAYHSHHMSPCSEPYVKALEDCGCAVADGATSKSSSSVPWYSSVHEGKRMTASDVTAVYWKDNLVSPVLFQQAVEQATISERVNIGVEVGCHPALKAPCLATIKNITSEELPYVGCMQRNGNDVEAFAAGLGYIWERFPEHLDADKFMSTVAPDHTPASLTKVLPKYPWDHSREYWTESRAISNYLRGPVPHLLLGTLSSASTASHLRWQNFIRPRDHDWLQGHDLQGQAVFPGAGYAVMALEAAAHVAGERPIQLLEVLDMSIDKAITFEDENSNVELLLTARLTSDTEQSATISFTIDSCMAKEARPSTSATGRVIVTFGTPDAHVLPTPQKDPPHMFTVDIEKFYKQLEDLGYQYSNHFRAVQSMDRTHAKATGVMDYQALQHRSRQIVLHPACLDVSFQTIMGAYSAPGDKRMRSLYVPVHVDRIAVDPAACLSAAGQVHYNASNTYDKGDFLAGHVEVSSGNGENSVLFEVENLLLKPLLPPSAAEDHMPFTHCVWGPLDADKVLDFPQYRATHQDKEAIPIIERCVFFWMKELLRQLTDEDRQNASYGHGRYIYWNEHQLDEARQGGSQWYDPAWESDTIDTIQKLYEENSYHPHLRMCKRVSENALSTIRDNTNPFIWMNEDGLLTEFYQSYLCSGPAWDYGKELSNQIAHRFQTMDILEIGGGTGSATKYILSNPQMGFNSYTFTDIGVSFFEKAREVFADHADRMEFRKLDVTKRPEDQGFKPHSYDMVVASSVLHATPKLVETMTNVRSLLKPGGQVVICEATYKEHNRTGYLFGLFPDWWAGVDEGRDLGPFATYPEWDSILKEAGFSGIESRQTDAECYLFPNTLFSARAISTDYLRLSDPLSAPLKEEYPQLVILGGQTPRTSAISSEIQHLLPHRRILNIKQLKDVKTHLAQLETKSTFIVLSELDQELFSQLDEETFDSFKSIFYFSANSLWLTENCWIDNPKQAMIVGALRSIRLEHTDLNVQCLDVDNLNNLDVKFVVEQALRLEEAHAGVADGMTWTTEPEVYLCKGRALVPRIKHDLPRNNRLNSTRRPILAQTNPSEKPVTLQESGALGLVEPLPAPIGSVPEPGNETIQVDFALVKAIRVGSFGGFWHVVQGRIQGTDREVVALSDSNASIVQVPNKRIFPLSGSGSTCVLASAAARLLAQSIVSTVAPSASILILEPPQFLVESLEQETKSRNVRLHLVSSTPAEPGTTAASWIRLHPQETDRRLKELLGSLQLAAFYDFSSSSLGRRVASHLPFTCFTYSKSHLVQDVAAPGMSLEDEQATVQISQSDLESDATPIMVSASQAAALGESATISTVIDWRAESSVAARLRPIDSGKLFIQDKTYLLVGLGTSIGRSLAQWMVEHGARHVVLSSRNPQIPDEEWMNDVERLGGDISVLPMDVSKEDSLDAGLAHIRKTLPPIGGIAYGPLVLKDALLRNMELETMEVVLRSKIIGAQLLHDRFADPATNPLDFFIMFSSAAGTGGNPGQSNYTAANAYLQSLAQKRHTKGLAASTIHIGATIGVGYLARTQREAEFAASSDMDLLTEDEFRTLFAEAVVSGRRIAGPDAVTDVTTMTEIEIGTGVPPLLPQYRDTIKIYDDPRFGNLRVPEQRDTDDGQSGSKKSVKELLLQATTMDEVRAVIIDGLSDKMRGTLHIPKDEKVNATTPLIDQGVDSLGAVTVATWFSKTLLLDIPILRVLSGASISELAGEAADRLPPSAIPLIASVDLDSSESSQVEDILEVTQDSSETSADSDLGPETDSGCDESSNIVRKAPLSLVQEHSWRLQQQLPRDPAIFHNTVGLYMEGTIDLDKLSKAVAEVFARHDIFRTAFIEGPSGELAQNVLRASGYRMECVELPDRAAAEDELKKVHKQQYNLSAGETFKIIDYHWGRDHHLFIIAYHRLAGDGSTTENLFAEISQLYSGAKLSQQASQYPDFAIRQRTALESGKMDEDLSYWTSMYTTIPAVLPVLALPNAQQEARSSPVAWDQHTGVARLNAVLAFRIRERAKRHKVSPMHFYLTAYHVLLARLAGRTDEDICVGIADTNRATVQDIAAMGYFANLLPVRMALEQTFAAQLEANKDRLRQAMQHARVPYSVTLERLGLGISAPTHAPLCQAVFDYRQGGAESGTIGDASIVEVDTSRERTPYDVVLEMSDDPAKDPLVTVKLQSSLYGPEHPKAFLDAYISVLTSVSSNTGVGVGDIKVGF